MMLVPSTSLRLPPFRRACCFFLGVPVPAASSLVCCTTVRISNRLLNRKSNMRKNKQTNKGISIIGISFVCSHLYVPPGHTCSRTHVRGLACCHPTLKLLSFFSHARLFLYLPSFLHPPHFLTPPYYASIFRAPALPSASCSLAPAPAFTLLLSATFVVIEST